MTDMILATFPRRDGEVRTAKQTYKNSTFVDLRLYCRKLDSLIPTQQGVTIRLTEVSALIAALQQLTAQEGNYEI